MTKTKLDVSQADLPIWSPWIVVVPVGEGDISTGRAHKISCSLLKHEAWDVARHAMDTRSDVVAMTVRRDTESFFY